MVEETSDDYVDHPIRSYVRTGGRARPTHRLTPATLLVGHTSPATAPETVGRQQREVLSECLGVISMAEMAVHLRQPVSVLAVIASDMIDAGLIGIRPGSDTTDGPSRETLQKVLHALNHL
ncbi:uncharacterized protein DUF742 [Nocardioides albertanoniae]|uniref:Uncharacterized protein DUF742 n=1 Tax=Nocardioides albertanoniae TaxID=1175486 RepID=A0A543A6H5_9ACTN|nr:DUF742 domain-containing protein [Nocardioides albertanoniae]TQL68178.1 uncharacterized protein DUF742 [Nocardioides albertanoniae]